jgi:pilus assembly protein TadC
MRFLRRGPRALPQPGMYIISSVIAFVLTLIIVVLFFYKPVIEGFRVKSQLMPPPIPPIPVGRGFLWALTAILGVGLFPIAFYSRRRYKVLKDLERQVPVLIRDFIGLLRSGMSVSDALEVMARRSYGPLDVFVKTLLRLTKAKYTFEEAFEEALKTVPRRLVRYLILIRESYRAGGISLELAGRIAALYAAIGALDELRESNLRAYAYILAMSVLVYSIGSGVIIYLASSMGHSRFIRPALGINDVVGILYYTGIMLALISGIFAGKIITGESLGGLWYAWLYILITALTILLSERILTTHIFP